VHLKGRNNTAKNTPPNQREKQRYEIGGKTIKRKRKHTHKKDRIKS